jgi:DNA-binding CsgD family transcriptional regulator
VESRFDEPVLRERDGELAELNDAIDAGTGRLVIVQGAPGIGKSELLRAARRRAAARGARVVSAHGSELEESFAYGVVRQLLERLLAIAEPAERSRWLTGAAALAEPILAPEASGGADAPETVGDRFAQRHGLFWLCANLAGEQPVLLAVDDAQWADVESLGFIGHLALRLEELPIVLVVALRSFTDAASEELSGLLRTASAGHLRPGPLSEDAVAEIAAEALGAPVDPAFAAACHRATGGNPLLVRELLRETSAQSVAPTAEFAGHVEGLRPQAIADVVLLRLARLAPAARDVARAVAILGDGIRVASAARLADLPVDTAGEAASELIAVEILERNETLGFIHPLVRAAVEGQVTPHERQAAHARAAAILESEGAPPERVAAHILASAPGDVVGAAQTLRAASRDAAARGGTAAATRYGARALDEQITTAERATLLVELGVLEKRADGAAAVAHLEEGVRLATEPAARARAATELGWGHILTDAFPEAVQRFETALATRPLPDELADRARAGILAAAVIEPDSVGAAADSLAGARRRTEADPSAGRGMLAASVAYLDARAGHERLATMDRALAALAAGVPVDEEGAMAEAFAGLSLIAGERLDDALRVWEAALARARARGSLFGARAACACQAAARLKLGDLAGAERDARDAIALAETYGSIAQGSILALLAAALLGRGDLPGAEAALAGINASTVGRRVYDLRTREVLGYARLARGRRTEAARMFLELGQLFSDMGGRNPGMVSWRAGAALAIAPDDPREAQRLAGAEVAESRAWGAPGALGRALRVAALVGPPGARHGTLLASEAVLRTSAARLELAETLCELGALERRAKHRTAAREPLHEALALATSCGADGLADRVRAELLASGIRVRAGVASRDVLTASEERIAGMAADGQSNREIAQALFVTLKTVETHLSHCYAKLGVRSRHELTSALTTNGARDQRRGSGSP